MIHTSKHNIFDNFSRYDQLNKDLVLQSFNQDKAMLEQAIDAVLNEKHLQSWRIASYVYHYIDENNPIIQNKLSELIQRLKSISSDGGKREILKLISKCYLQESHCEQLIDICTDIWIDSRKQGSVRSESFKILYKISNLYPDLKPELLLMYNTYSESLSNGIKYSLEKLKNQIEKEINKN